MSTTLLLNGISPVVNSNGDERANEAVVVNFACEKDGTFNHICSTNQFLQIFNSFPSTSRLQPIGGTVRNFNTGQTILAYKCSKCQSSQTFSLEIRTSSAPIRNTHQLFATLPILPAFENVTTSFNRARGVEFSTNYKCKICSDVVQFSIRFGDAIPQQLSSFLSIATSSLPYRNASDGTSVIEAKIGYFCSKCRQFCNLGMTFSEQKAPRLQNAGSVLDSPSPSPSTSKSSTISAPNNVNESDYDDAQIAIRSVKPNQPTRSNTVESAVSVTVTKPAPEKEGHQAPGETSTGRSTPSNQGEEGGLPECGVCSERFSSEKSLRFHVAHYKGDCRKLASTRCRFCQRAYSCSGARRKHERSVHAAEWARSLGTSAAKCQGCSALFDTQTSLLIHKRTCPRFRHLANTSVELIDDSEISDYNE